MQCLVWPKANRSARTMILTKPSPEPAWHEWNIPEMRPAWIRRAVGGLAAALLVALAAAPVLAQVTIMPAAMPNARAGSFYGHDFYGSGGQAPYSILVGSRLPRGLSAIAGMISGTPSEVGSFPIRVHATDINGLEASADYTLVVEAPSIAIFPTALSNARAGTFFFERIRGALGTEPYEFSVSSGAVPPGMSLTSVGTLSGRATASGTFQFTVSASDSTLGGPFTGSHFYSMVVDPPILTVTPTSLANARAGAAYSSTLSAAGGTGPYNFALDSGALPAGLALQPSGALSGTPTETGTFNFIVKVTDATAGTPGVAVQTYTMVVDAPDVSMQPEALPDPALGIFYDQGFDATGGTGPYTYSFESGTLPAGLTLSPIGRLSGTATEAGTFTFAIRATDSTSGPGSHSGSRSYTITLAPPSLALSPAAIPEVTAGQAYSQSFLASGGIAPYAYSISAGSLPLGLTLSPAGVLSGTPIETGIFNFTLRAQDATTGQGYPFFVAQDYALRVDPPSMALSPETLAAARVGVAYSQSLTASGGQPPYGYVVTSGALPPGLTLAPSGELAGVPTLAGESQFAVTASDSSPGSGPYSVVESYTISVAALGSVTIVVRSDADGVYGFRSSVPALDGLVVSTAGGSGRSPAMELAAGMVEITADDQAGAGIGLEAIACDDADSSTSLENRSARIMVGTNESIVCTFSFVASRSATTALMRGVIETRAALILANLPASQRRIDRLNGTAAALSLPAEIMSYLPELADGSAVRSAVSLGAIAAAAGDMQPNPFDLWLEGSFARLSTEDDRFMRGAAGMDYLVSRDLLIGLFLQMDQIQRGQAGEAGWARGRGWLSGPYATVRLAEHLYLDMLAGFGRSTTRIDPLGLYEDDFSATRWLLSAALEGQWDWGPWTLSPRARLSYFEERTDAYADTLGVAIPSMTVGLGQAAIGPSVVYHLLGPGEITINVGARVEAVAELSADRGLEAISGRAEASMDALTPTGARLGLTLAVDQLGQQDKYAIGLSGRLNVPIR